MVWLDCNSIGYADEEWIAQRNDEETGALVALKEEKIKMTRRGVAYYWAQARPNEKDSL